MAYHGTGGIFNSWLNGYYDLQYFQDMFAYLEERLSFGKRRVRDQGSGVTRIVCHLERSARLVLAA